MTLRSINTEQKLYVINCGDGYTTLGFNNAYKRAQTVANWIRSIGHAPCCAVLDGDIGTEIGHQQYVQIMNQANTLATSRRLRCPAELTPQLIGLEGKRVEVVDCYGEQRRFNVGKSTGWMPCHLELANARSSGGPAVAGAPFRSIRVIK